MLFLSGSLSLLTTHKSSHSHFICPEKYRDLVNIALYLHGRAEWPELLTSDLQNNWELLKVQKVNILIRYKMHELAFWCDTEISRARKCTFQIAELLLSNCPSKVTSKDVLRSLILIQDIKISAPVLAKRELNSFEITFESLFLIPKCSEI